MNKINTILVFILLIIALVVRFVFADTTTLNPANIQSLIVINLTQSTTTISNGLFVSTTTPPTNGASALFRQNTSSTIYIGGASSMGCIVLGDSANGANVVYITATGATISATTTKPKACR